MFIAPFSSPAIILLKPLNKLFNKFKLLCKGKINPKNVNLLKTSNLKKCGLSRQKAKGIKELSKKFLNKSFNPKLINNMSDEEAIEYLSSLRQIGKWSAEMILLFTYNRPDIWPVQDIGLLRAISNNYKKKLKNGNIINISITVRYMKPLNHLAKKINPRSIGAETSMLKASNCFS